MKRHNDCCARLRRWPLRPCWSPWPSSWPTGWSCPALAQNDESALGNLNLTSDTPGEIEVSWTAPSLAPSDYRLSWTPDGEAYPSYKDANQADRGNTYPEGDQTSLTLTGLTAGAEYKVQVRARYNDGEHADQPWAGPWREAAVTVAGREEPAPTPQPEPTPTPTSTPVPEPTPTPTPAPDDHDVIQGLSLASSEPGQLVVTWEVPETTPTDYRISWAQSSLSFPSYKDSNGPEKGNLSPLGSETTLTLDNLTPGVDYKIHMRARYYNADRSEHLSSGPWTDTVTQRVKDHPPAAPTGLTTSDIEHDSMTLTWEDPEDNTITGYRVLRGPDADSLSTLKTNTESASTEYEDATVEPETTYHYAVLAMSQDGNSVQSDAISATTPAAPSSGEQDAPREAPKKEDPPQRVGPRQAMTTTDVWTATLTPAALGGESFGCTFNCSNATVLSDNDFTYDSTDYTISNFYIISNGNLRITLDTDITTATASDLTLVVGTTSFAFASADTATARYRIWNSTSLSWTAGTDVAVKLTASTAANTPAAGAPAITAPNVFRVPAVLGVDLSEITDAEGVTNIAGNATYKWQRFDSTGVTLDTDNIGTGSTYTLTDTDATKTLKVVVNFTDDASNSEGPLTSAATSAITAAASCNTPTYVGGATQTWTGKLGVKSYGILHGFHHQEEGSSLENPTFTTASSNNYEFTILTNASRNWHYCYPD